MSSTFPPASAMGAAPVATSASQAAPGSATARLMSVLHRLCRARQRQVLTALAAQAVLAGTVLAAVAVLVARLRGAPLAPLPALAVCTGLSLLVGALLARWRWPDPMSVAISADLSLDLAQRLSTASELCLAGRRPELVERLADQVIHRGRLMERYRQLFPARWSNAGKLLPVALLVLILVATVDMPVSTLPSVQAPATDVSNAGLRLQTFGRDMHARAQAGGLGRSEQASRHVQALGTAMRDGRMERVAALTRLRTLNSELGEMQRSALGAGPGSGAARARPSVGDAAARTVDASSFGDPLDANGEGQPTTDLRVEDLERPGLEGAGITQAELRASLAGAAQGDEPGLAESARRAAGGDAAMRDAQLLAEARDALDRARRELGDSSATGSDAEPEGAGDSFAGGPMDLPGEGGGEGGDFDDASGGRGTGADGTGGPRDQVDGDQGGRTSALLRPQALPGGDGPLRRGTMRALPRLNEAPATLAPAASPPERGIESALARESYPPRYKALVKRYFVGRANGEHVPADTPSAAGELPSRP